MERNMESERLRIGMKIAETRKAQGLSQGELADKIGLRQNAISRIEQGKFSVGFDTLQKIAEVLSKKIDLV